MDFYYSETDGITLFKNIRKRDLIRTAFNVDYRVLPKTEFSKNSNDAFGNVIAQCFYDEKDFINGIEIYDLESNLFIKNKEMISIKKQELLQNLELLDIVYQTEEDDTGINIFNDTVRFYIPEMDNEGDEALVESVYIEIPELK